MKEEQSISKELIAFKETLGLHKESLEFIKRHKVWSGFMAHGWVSKLVTIIAILFSLVFVGILIDWLKGIFSMDDTLIGTTSSMLSELKGLLFLEGGFKYLALILLEVLVFHCSTKTLNVLTNDYLVPEYNDFMAAVKRMIQVAFSSWIKELIAIGIISIPFSILGLNSFKFLPIIIIQAYFLGFAFMDNYAEQYGITIKESGRINKNHIGATIAIGGVALLLFKIPLIGLLLGSLIAATTAALYLFKKKCISYRN